MDATPRPFAISSIRWPGWAAMYALSFATVAAICRGERRPTGLAETGAAAVALARSGVAVAAGAAAAACSDKIAAALASAARRSNSDISATNASTLREISFSMSAMLRS
ncbi:MAG: hypothetical protein D6689_10265 [Deltaproteobacteria bacterium]|nr:MAG: hypothetical protein D6689_10265 [Deltaproteobacteria bacterium]